MNVSQDKFDNKFQSAYDRRRQREKDWSNSTQGKVWKQITNVIVVLILTTAITATYAAAVISPKYRHGRSSRLHHASIESRDDMLGSTIGPVAGIALLASIAFVATSTHVNALRALGVLGQDKAP